MSRITLASNLIYSADTSFLMLYYQPVLLGHLLALISSIDFIGHCQLGFNVSTMTVSGAKSTHGLGFCTFTLPAFYDTTTVIFPFRSLRLKTQMRGLSQSDYY